LPADLHQDKIKGVWEKKLKDLEEEEFVADFRAQNGDAANTALITDIQILEYQKIVSPDGNTIISGIEAGKIFNQG